MCITCNSGAAKGGVVGFSSEYNLSAVPWLLLETGTRSEQLSIQPRVKIADFTVKKCLQPDTFFLYGL